MNKVCARCNLSKEFGLFGKDRQKKDGLSSYCKECYSNINHERYIKHAGQRRAYKKRGSLTTAEYAKVWRKENPVLAKQYRDTWAKKNVPKLRAKGMRRYVSQTQQTPKWLNPAHKAEIEGFYLFCQLFKGFQVDHIVPIRGKTVSGMHVPWNLQVLTCEENRVKRNSTQHLEIK